MPGGVIGLLQLGGKHSMEEEQTTKKPYVKPEIIYEADLEVHAGSPLGPINADTLDGSEGAP